MEMDVAVENNLSASICDGPLHDGEATTIAVAVLPKQRDKVRVSFDDHVGLRVGELFVRQACDHADGAPELDDRAIGVEKPFQRLRSGRSYRSATTNSLLSVLATAGLSTLNLQPSRLNTLPRSSRVAAVAHRGHYRAGKDAAGPLGGVHVRDVVTSAVCESLPSTMNSSRGRLASFRGHPTGVPGTERRWDGDVSLHGPERAPDV
jgi:hypothetical protein